MLRSALEASAMSGAFPERGPRARANPGRPGGRGRPPLANLTRTTPEIVAGNQVQPGVRAVGQPGETTAEVIRLALRGCGITRAQLRAGIGWARRAHELARGVPSEGQE